MQRAFETERAAQRSEHAETLRAFERDMDALRRTQLHPAIVSASERARRRAATRAKEEETRARRFAANAAAGGGGGGGGGGGED